MEKSKKTLIFKNMIIAAVFIVLTVSVFFLIGRYAWKLGGFDSCESAGIEQITVSEDKVEISGYSPSLSTKGFLGYHAEEKDGKLYVGFKFSALFGIFETGDFNITVPTKNEITEIYIKTAENEYLIWSADGTE